MDGSLPPIRFRRVHRLLRTWRRASNARQQQPTGRNKARVVQIQQPSGWAVVGLCACYGGKYATDLSIAPQERAERRDGN